MIDLNLLYEDVYNEYLEKSSEKLMKEALEEQDNMLKGLSAFQTIMEMEMDETLNEDETNALQNVGVLASALADMFKAGMNLNNDKDNKIDALKQELDDNKKVLYNAMPTDVKIKSFSTLKFPDNIVFIINQIITWLKNVVKKLIDSVSNFLRRAVGLSYNNKSEVSEEDLALKLRSAQAIEKNRMQTVSGAVKGLHFSDLTPAEVETVMSSLKNFEESAGFLAEAPTYMEPKDGATDVEGVQGSFANPKEGKKDEKGNAHDNRVNPGKYTNPYWVPSQYPENNQRKFDDKNIKNSNIYSNVTIEAIDISQDLYHLKEAIAHFFSLFDNSIGSNDEMLFKTDDLEMMLKLLQATAKSIASGDQQLYAIGNKLTTSDVVSAERLRDNLVRTKVNTDNLRAAYRETQEIIQRTLTVINSKQSLAATAPGIGMNWRLLSSASYKQLSDILKIIKKREKEAVKLEKGLAKMQRSYDDLVKQLDKLKGAYLTLPANVTFTTVMQKQVSDLADASKYMAQTVTLRFLTLGMYIREIQEIKALINNLNSINKANRNYKPF